MSYRFVLTRWHLAGCFSALLLIGSMVFFIGFVSGGRTYEGLTAGAGTRDTEPRAHRYDEVRDADEPDLVEATAREPEADPSPVEEPSSAPPELSADVSRRLAEVELHFEPSHAIPQTPYGELIYRVAWRHAMNPQLVAAVVQAESAFDPEAVSSRGARGLMQVLPQTASRFGIDGTLLHEPEFNLIAGVSYLSWLSERFGGDPRRVLAAYNAGEAAVERYDGVPPFHETRNYLTRVDSLMHGR